MLRISKIMDYGTLVLTHMAGSPERLCSAPELAKTLGLNLPTVSKVLKLLGRQGLVRSVRGVHGGYALSRPASEISIAQVMDALDEQPFGITECSASPGNCDFEADCSLRDGWQRINATVRRALEEVSVADMAQPQPVAFTSAVPSRSTMLRQTTL